MNKVLRSLFLLYLFSLVLSCAGKYSDKEQILFILPEKDFYQPEFIIPVETLKSTGFEIITATSSGNKAVGISGLEVFADYSFAEIKSKDFKALLLVGGYGGESLLGNEELHRIIRDFHRERKIIGAQCITPVFLAQADIIDGKDVTCWSSYSPLLEEEGARYTGKSVEIIGNIVTGMAGSEENINYFTESFISALVDKDYSIEQSTPLKSDITDFSINNDYTAFTVRVNGINRSGALYLPPNPNSAENPALCFVLHGSGGTGEAMRQNGFDELAERMNFIMVYPDGISGHWNWTPRSTGTGDDIGFFRAIIDELDKEYNINRDKIYATGFSAGGFMSYRIAGDMPGVFSAILPVCGLMMKGHTIETVEPLNVVHIHNQDDPVVPYNGTLNSSFTVKEGLDFWKQINGTDRLTESLKEGPLQEEYWINENTGKMTASWIFERGGHGWVPGLTEKIMSYLYTLPDDIPSYYITEKSSICEAYGNYGNGEVLSLSISGDDLIEVKAVEFFEGNSSIGKTTIKPWSVEWQGPERGQHRISAMIELNNGKQFSAVNFPSFIFSSPSLAREIAVEVSSVEIPSLAGENLCDGKFDTRWSSEYNDNEFFILDLGITFEVNALTFLWETASANSYSLEGSTDGENWANIKTVTNSQGGMEFIDFERVPLQFIRFSGIERSTEYGYSLWEVLVHGE